MEAKLNRLASDITGLVRNFMQTEIAEYKENYDYMLRSPLCQKLMREIEELKRKNAANDMPPDFSEGTANASGTANANQSFTYNSDGEYYNFDRKYMKTPSTGGGNIELEIQEEETGNEDIPTEAESKINGETSEYEEVTDDESGGDEVEVTDNGEEEVEEEGLGESSQEEVEVTDDEEEVEEVEVTDDESGGEGSPLDDDEEEVEEVEVTDDESGGEEEGLGESSQEEVEVTDNESGGEEEGMEESSQEEDEDEEEEEVFEFKYKGKKYFATNEVNGILYANVDDDIGDEVGKIQNKNVILF